MPSAPSPAALEPIVVLTGAGISAESGVPTFRGAQGLWQSRKPQELATPAAFAQDPALVWQFYHWRRQLLSSCSPNAAHHSLVEIEATSSDFCLITQNVDGLHQAAGSQQVLELHGSIWRLKCIHCPQRWEDRRVPHPEALPICPACGALARPDVVWFGENLDAALLQQAFEYAARARTMLVVGTSALVQPAAQIPLLAGKARLIEINPETTPLSGLAEISLREKASSALPRLWQQLKSASA